jgi:hypothetical protein
VSNDRIIDELENMRKEAVVAYFEVPENEGSTLLRNVGELLPDYTASLPKNMLLFKATAVRSSNLTKENIGECRNYLDLTV